MDKSIEMLNTSISADKEGVDASFCIANKTSTEPKYSENENEALLESALSTSITS